MANILVVDDSAVDRALVSRLLSVDKELSVHTANDGREALALMDKGGVDAVVTDLQMPEMDGLQLVTAIRLQHPAVPVILMTAKGSEVIAIEALQQGAASYVPKQRLSEWLVDTVYEVLSLSKAERAYQELIGAFKTAAFQLVLGNDVKVFEPFADYVQQIATGMGVCDATGGYQLAVALREALYHAAYHGNLEITPAQLVEESERLVQGKPSLIEERRNALPYRDRQLQVGVQITRDQVTITIRDEGPGIDVSTLPSDTQPADLTDGSSRRGLILMRTLLDKVEFDAAGKEITLVKSRSRQ
jgi:CheY-like chemotaxis protein/anti-sigma regulatory factor (Ser/Thr protein kinase)